MTLTTIDDLSKIVAFSGDEDDTVADEPEEGKGFGLEDDELDDEKKKKSDEEDEEGEGSGDELVDDDDDDDDEEEGVTEE